MDHKFRMETRDIIGTITVRAAMGFVERRCEQHGCTCEACQVNIRSDVANGVAGAMGGVLSSLLYTAKQRGFDGTDEECRQHCEAVARIWMDEVAESFFKQLIAEKVIPDPDQIERKQDDDPADWWKKGGDCEQN